MLGAPVILPAEFDPADYGISRTTGNVQFVVTCPNTQFGESVVVVGEDGVHLVFFSDREDANWKMIQPGETRLMLMLHMSVGAGTHSVGGFEVAELEALFDMGKGEPEHAITAYLVTNTGDEAVRFKLNKAEQRCFAHAGAVTVHGEPQFKRALSADFAFVFDDRQVAGHVRFSK